MLIIDSMERLSASQCQQCVLLYSGGLDGSYFLAWAQDHGIDVVALHVGLEGETNRDVSSTAAALGADYLFADRTPVFATTFIAAAIRANGYYQGLYPVCSSLSRPLLAEVAVEIARMRQIDVVVHTSTSMQNSAARLTRSIMTLDPGLTVAAPFLRSAISRRDKMDRLLERGLPFVSRTYSIDANLWGRVIECGCLEHPGNDIPDDGVFEWTRPVSRTPIEPEIIDLELAEGLPSRLNGESMPIDALIRALNAMGGRHGVGRFSGLEEIIGGAKNHEVREAPAAQILITAHRELEAAVLTQAELTLKSYLDAHWINLIVGGGWHSDLSDALRAFASHLNRLVEGRVRLRLHRGNLSVLSKDAPAGLYYAGFADQFEALMREFSFPQMYALMELPSYRRRARTDAARSWTAV